MRGGIPADIQAFILDRIQSVEQLEVLLYLAQHPEASVTAEGLARELRSSPRSIERWLKNLKGQKLLVESEGQQFSYSPESEELVRRIELLGELYPQRRVRFIEMIFNKPAIRMQSFADAFRLRGGSDEE